MTKWAVIVLIVLVLLYAATMLVGAHNHGGPPPSKDGKPPAFAGSIDRMVGWAAPGIDPQQIAISGGTWTPDRHLLQLPAKQSATIRVAAAPDQRSRNLGLRLVDPAPAAKPAAFLTYRADGPLPDGTDSHDLPPDGGGLFPDPHAGDRDDGARRLGLPIYSVGATITLRAGDRPLSVEVK